MTCCGGPAFTPIKGSDNTPAYRKNKPTSPPDWASARDAKARRQREKQIKVFRGFSVTLEQMFYVWVGVIFVVACWKTWGPSLGSARGSDEYAGF